MACHPPQPTCEVNFSLNIHDGAALSHGRLLDGERLIVLHGRVAATAAGLSLVGQQQAHHWSARLSDAFPARCLTQSPISSFCSTVGITADSSAGHMDSWRVAGTKTWSRDPGPVPFTRRRSGIMPVCPHPLEECTTLLLASSGIRCRARPPELIHVVVCSSDEQLTVTCEWVVHQHALQSLSCQNDWKGTMTFKA